MVQNYKKNLTYASKSQEKFSFFTYISKSVFQRSFQSFLSADCRYYLSCPVPGRNEEYKTNTVQRYNIFTKYANILVYFNYYFTRN